MSALDRGPKTLLLSPHSFYRVLIRGREVAEDALVGVAAGIEPRSHKAQSRGLTSLSTAEPQKCNYKVTESSLLFEGSWILPSPCHGNHFHTPLSLFGL